MVTEQPPRQATEDAIRLIYEATKDIPNRQVQDLDALNTKIVQIFTIASVVIGLAGFGKATSDAEVSNWVTGLLLAGLAAYGVTAVLAIWNLTPKLVERVPPVNLWNTHYDLTDIQIRYGLVEAIAKAAVKNRVVAERKAGMVRWVMGGTAIEIALVSLALIVSKV